MSGPQQRVCETRATKADRVVAQPGPETSTRPQRALFVSLYYPNLPPGPPLEDPEFSQRALSARQHGLVPINITLGSAGSVIFYNAPSLLSRLCLYLPWGMCTVLLPRYNTLPLGLHAPTWCMYVYCTLLTTPPYRLNGNPPTTMCFRR